jgi:hypothetical protein
MRFEVFAMLRKLALETFGKTSSLAFQKSVNNGRSSKFSNTFIPKPRLSESALLTVPVLTYFQPVVIAKSPIIVLYTHIFG